MAKKSLLLKHLKRDTEDEEEGIEAYDNREEELAEHPREKSKVRNIKHDEMRHKKTIQNIKHSIGPSSMAMHKMMKGKSSKKTLFKRKR